MPAKPRPRGNRYETLLRHVFLNGYKSGSRSIPFSRDDLAAAAAEVGVSVPKNLPDAAYAFRHRGLASPEIEARTPAGMEWRLRGKGKSKYAFDLVERLDIVPTTGLEPILIPDSTPELIAVHAQTDEQALLAKLRYNRLIDIFLGLATYSLQNHWRTSVPGLGQVEVDELYVGIDGNGSQYIIPVQAKGEREQPSALQAENDIKCCELKYPSLICRAVSAQFVDPSELVLFELREDKDLLRIEQEVRYRLVRGKEEINAWLESQ